MTVSHEKSYVVEETYDLPEGSVLRLRIDSAPWKTVPLPSGRRIPFSAIATALTGHPVTPVPLEVVKARREAAAVLAAEQRMALRERYLRETTAQPPGRQGPVCEGWWAEEASARPGPGSRCGIRPARRGGHPRGLPGRHRWLCFGCWEELLAQPDDYGDDD